MARPEKVQAVADIKNRFETAGAVFFTEYAGLDVKQQQALRRALLDVETDYKVVKMTLARRAAADLGLDDVEPLMYGPTALAFAGGDPVTAAKTLQDFADQNARLLIKGALMSGELLSPERVGHLARIEPLEVLLAKIAGAMAAPMAMMAGALGALLRNSASVFAQLLERKEGDAAPATPAAPAEAEPEAAAEPAGEDAAPESGAAAETVAGTEAEPEGEADTAAPGAGPAVEAEPDETAPAEEAPAAEAAADDEDTDDTDHDEPAAEAEEEK